jgi:Protein of unknown function (DUF3768)
MDPRTVRIRALNDELRQNLAGGVAVMTPGVAALGQEAVDRIVKTIAVFDDFCHANDPYEEHDFGSFEAEGHTIFFKIDYFDRNEIPVPRSDRPGRHRSRDHGHAGRRILTGPGSAPRARSTHRGVRYRSKSRRRRPRSSAAGIDPSRTRGQKR